MGFGKDNTGVIIREFITVALGTLAAKTGVLTGVQNIGSDFRMLKSVLQGWIVALTAGQGALSLYLINGELSLSEAEGCIESSGPSDRNDRIGVELAERFVRYVGDFIPRGDGTIAALGSGHGAEVKPRWTFSHPEAWNWMIYNHSNAALSTGAQLDLMITDYGVWIG